MTFNIPLDRNPFRQFSSWFEEALYSKENQPEAMVLATATKDGIPSSRVVLYKGISEGGFLIFTNFLSRKAKELDDNPHASLVIHWPTFQRQIRMEGKVEKISAEDSEQYFQTRDRESCLGAWASRQSDVLTSRKELDEKFIELEKKFLGKPVPCPPFWGGYRLIPHRFEFWLGRPNRLHDRFVYHALKPYDADSDWKIERLAP